MVFMEKYGLYINHQVTEKQEGFPTRKALKRLLPCKDTCVLGNSTAKRQAILSFLVYSTTNSRSDSKNRRNMGVLYMWEEAGNKRDKLLHGSFVAALLNDLFGIQARGGCACAGPYGHALLHVNESSSLCHQIYH
jgi:selenocysteine lyase/cysteine desulfurase